MSEVIVVVRVCWQVRPSFIQWASSWCQLPPNPFVNGETAMQRVQHGPHQGQTLLGNKAILRSTSGTSLYIYPYRLHVYSNVMDTQNLITIAKTKTNTETRVHLPKLSLQSNSSRERYHSGIYDNNAGAGQVSPSSHLLSPYNAVACGT